MIPDDMKLKCSTCGQEIDSLLSHICAPAEPLAELDALRARVAELEAALRRINTTAIMVQNRAAQVMGEPDTLRRAMSEITSLAIKIKANATEYID